MSRSETLFNNAQKHIPGGVNSPVRAFKSVGGTPLFFATPKAPMYWTRTTSATWTMSAPGAR